MKVFFFKFNFCFLIIKLNVWKETGLLIQKYDKLRQNSRIKFDIKIGYNLCYSHMFQYSEKFLWNNIKPTLNK